MKGPSSRFWLLSTVAWLVLCCERNDGAFLHKPAAPEPNKIPTSLLSAPQDETRADAPEISKILHFRSLLKSGRQAVQNREYEAGRALLEQALTVRPFDPRLLLEIGWAAHLAGDTERAQEVTGKALRGSVDPDIKGIALYNLARMAEKRREISKAMELYHASSKYRPSIEVQKRLAFHGYRYKPGANPPSSTSILGPMAGPASSLTAVCATLIGQHAEEEEQVGCEEKAAIALEIDEPVLRRALLLPVWLGSSGAGFESAIEVMHYFVIETNAGLFHTRSFAWHLYGPGAFGIVEELKTSLQREQALPGGPSEIIVRGLHRRRDRDVGLLEEENVETEHVLVCGLLDAEPSCMATIPVRHSYSRSVMHVEGIENVPHSEHTPGLPIKTSYHFDVRFDGAGNYALRALAPIKGNAAARDHARAGTFSLRPARAR